MISFVIALLLACGFSSLEGSVVSRPLTFKNSCPHNVRVGFTAGAIPGTTCSSCPQGGICNPNINMCFYSSPFDDGFLDLSSGEDKEIKIEFDQGALYSGAFFASTGCEHYKNACETGVCRDKVKFPCIKSGFCDDDCSIREQVCSSFAGPVGPHTRAEFTFDGVFKDFYDISLMHGINIPISMKPLGGEVTPTDPYSCGTAGDPFSKGSLPPCTYGYNPVVGGTDHSSNVIFVAPPDLEKLVACESNSDCASVKIDLSQSHPPLNGTTSQAVCGLHAGRDPTGLPTNSVPKVCGKAVGLWTADEVCVYSGGQYAGAPYTCNKAAKHGTYSELYGCAGGYSTSGYQRDSQSELACGCYDWDMPEDTKCQAVNPEWVEIAFPWAKFVKDVCPLAYSYAYDDMTSTFTCGGLTLGYTIEMCPGGFEVHRL